LAAAASVAAFFCRFSLTFLMCWRRPADAVARLFPARVGGGGVGFAGSGTGSSGVGSGGASGSGGSRPAM